MHSILYILFVLIFSSVINSEKIVELKVDHNVLYLRNVFKPTGALKLSIGGLKDAKAEFNENSIVFIRDNSQLVIKFHKTRKRFNHTLEYELVWFNVKDVKHEICFHYGFNNASWYSTYEARHNRWPMNTEKSLDKKTEFTTGGRTFGPVMEYLFVNTDGFAIMLDHLHPWFIQSKNAKPNDPNSERLLCFSLGKMAPYERKEENMDHPKKYFSIRLKILTSANIRAVHQAAILDHRYIDTPKEVPDLSVMQSPSWNTQSFVKEKKHLDLEVVTEFAHEIANRNYSHFLLVIDGEKWQRRKGSLTFEPEFYNDKTETTFLTSEFDKLGFKIAIFVSVFVNDYIPDFDEHYLVRNVKTDSKCETIDFTDQRAADLFVKRLNNLRKSSGVYTFKFVQGDVDTYKSVFKTQGCAFENGDIVGKYPNLFTTHYGQTCARLGNAIELQAAFKMQRLPLFVRGLSKESAWEIEANGLQQELINILTVSIAGYSFYKSDLICGNEECDDELYIRWMQAVTFFPGMQFSIPPWTKDKNVIDIMKKLMQLRAKLLPKLIELANRVVQFGEPMVRPMWYEAPKDAQSYVIWDQYMLGSELLVAPVVYQDAIERQVYFPAGNWQDQHGTYHKGPVKKVISAPLEELPHFVRVFDN